MQFLTIDDYSIPYVVYRRKLKAYRLEFDKSTLKVILPLKADENHVINKHRRWIKNSYKKINDIINGGKKLNNCTGSKEHLYIELKNISSRIEEELRVKSKGIKIKKMRSQWGSISTNGIININEYTKYLPEKCKEYIVFHELLHLKYRGHGKSFKERIEKKYPKAKKIEKELFKYWILIQNGVLNCN
ncbi:M48 family metallopeptidase [Elusimicrobiota bacterium]